MPTGIKVKVNRKSYLKASDNYKSPFTEEQEAEIKKLTEQGKTPHFIATKLNIPKQHVYQFLDFIYGERPKEGMFNWNDYDKQLF